MIFLTAQPDDFYFLWQLELQIHNFNNLGIQPENIHILISYDKKKGLAHYFIDFINEYKGLANFFTYEDRRERKGYIPSIRANIIKQHFNAIPDLTKETIFYHDSDILFRVLPDFEALTKGDTWFISDTRSYIGSKYIVKMASEDILDSMCNIVGIEKGVVIENDENAGGAQYLLKNTDYEFWDKVEKDSEDIYSLLKAYAYKNAESEYINNKKARSECFGIQSWCADMWALLWNAWLFGHKTEISPELGFSWAINTIDKWYQHKIFHYTGGVKKEDLTNFQKNRYVKYQPYYDTQIDRLLPTLCGFIIKDSINTLLEEKKKKRITHNDTQFVVVYRHLDDRSLKDLVTNLRYLRKTLSNDIVVLEVSESAVIPLSLLLYYDCRHVFFETTISDAGYSKVIEQYLFYTTKASCIVFLDYNIILCNDTIASLKANVTNNEAIVIAAKEVVSYGAIVNQTFSKLLDADFFKLNIGKGHVDTIDHTPVFITAKDCLVKTNWVSQIIKDNKIASSVKQVNVQLYKIASLM